MGKKPNIAVAANSLTPVRCARLLIGALLLVASVIGIKGTIDPSYLILGEDPDNVAMYLIAASLVLFGLIKSKPELEVK